MGDHRQNSLDSRYHQTDENHGMVPVDDVVGRAIVVAWPINRWGTLPVPDTFDQPGLDKQSSAAASLPYAPERPPSRVRCRWPCGAAAGARAAAGGRARGVIRGHRRGRCFPETR